MARKQNQACFEEMGNYAESLGFFKGHRFIGQCEKAIANSDFMEFATLTVEQINAHEGEPHLAQHAAQIGPGRLFHHLIDIYHHPVVAGNSAKDKAKFAYVYLLMALPMFRNPPLYTEFKKSQRR